MTSIERSTILIIENNPHMRRIIREMLIGFSVPNILEADGVTRGHAIVLKRRIDLVILDFFLDTLDGADFTRMVRTDPRCINRAVPILLVTALPNHAKVLKMRDAGVNEILAKPLAPRDVYARIMTMLTGPREFIANAGYVGPCRRRRIMDYPTGRERRHDELERLKRQRISSHGQL